MPFKSKKIKLIFLIYWFLLAYIIAALVWWYIALSRQNEQMSYIKLRELKKENNIYNEQYRNIGEEKKRKTAQYIGEGSIFFLLIAAGAIFVYKAVKKQLQVSQQQQNFMIAITHELKTPIAITKLNLETLLKRKLDDLQQERLLSNTLHEANRMNALCNNMLLSSQIESGGYRITSEETNLAELVRNCVNDFVLRYPHRQMIAAISDEMYTMGDELLLQMVVNNLIDNALKYSPKESTVHVNLAENENKIELRVTDEGGGIDEKEKEKVFEKFYRLGNEATKRAKGTGLGLYLTSRIVAAHHGKICIRDNYPSGSVFIVQLKQSV